MAQFGGPTIKQIYDAPSPSYDGLPARTEYDDSALGTQLEVLSTECFALSTALECLVLRTKCWVQARAVDRLPRGTLFAELSVDALRPQLKIPRGP